MDDVSWGRPQFLSRLLPQPPRRPLSSTDTPDGVERRTDSGRHRCICLPPQPPRRSVDPVHSARTSRGSSQRGPRTLLKSVRRRPLSNLPGSRHVWEGVDESTGPPHTWEGIRRPEVSGPVSRVYHVHPLAPWGTRSSETRLSSLSRHTPEPVRTRTPGYWINPDPVGVRLRNSFSLTSDSRNTSSGGTPHRGLRPPTESVLPGYVNDSTRRTSEFREPEPRLDTRTFRTTRLTGVVHRRPVVGPRMGRGWAIATETWSLPSRDDRGTHWTFVTVPPETSAEPPKIRKGPRDRRTSRPRRRGRRPRHLSLHPVSTGNVHDTCRRVSGVGVETSDILRPRAVPGVRHRDHENPTPRGHGSPPGPYSPGDEGPSPGRRKGGGGDTRGGR